MHFNEQGLARVGWSYQKASFDLGTDKFGWGYGGTAKKSNSREFKDYGLTFGEKFDIVGCIIDMNNGEISFTKNGRNLGVAFRIDPRSFDRNGIFPSICVKNAGCKVRFERESDGPHDHKPADCVWVSEAPKDQVVVSDTEHAYNSSSKNNRASRKDPLAIILEPSRELAEQTFKCIESFSKGLNLNTVLLTGGYSDHTNKLDKRVDIVVATPGKIDEVIRNQQILLDHIRFFVLDEADGLLQNGHNSLITRLHDMVPRMSYDGRRVQTVCCSATLHNFEVKKLAERLMYFPIWIDLKGEDSVPETVHHVVFRIDPGKDDVLQYPLNTPIQTDGVHYDDRINLRKKHLNNKEELSEAVKVLKCYYAVKAIDALKIDQAIIFCRTKLDCDNLERYFISLGQQARDDGKYSCVCLHADRKPAERQSNLLKFKAAQVKFLICTDVAARGIDITGIPFVLQLTLPDEKANYLHRIGRVGRADRMGLAISFVSTVPEKVWYHSNCRNNRNCHNTNLTDRGGCCIWYDELQLLADIEEHLRTTIQEIEADFTIQVNEYDGKVIYGGKRLENSHTYEGHVDQLKTLVSSLANFESKAQDLYLMSYV